MAEYNEEIAKAEAAEKAQKEKKTKDMLTFLGTGAIILANTIGGRKIDFFVAEDAVRDARQIAEKWVSGATEETIEDLTN